MASSMTYGEFKKAVIASVMRQTRLPEEEAAGVVGETYGT